MNVKLWHKQYKNHSEKWDHDHCAFCWEKFSEAEGNLHEGYCTFDKNHWVCERCFNDFKGMFKWQVVN